MLTILSSDTDAPNTLFRDVPRDTREDNLQWLHRTLDTDDQVTSLVMVGGRDPIAFRLRVAQSHARHDLMPSHWSHVMLLGPRSQDLEATPVIEVSLEPPGGFGFPPPANGVQRNQLGHYRTPESYPNIAWLAVPVAELDVMSALERFQMQRTVLDTPELVLRWLAFTWGVARTGNPLLDGQGISSAAMLEAVVGAAGMISRCELPFTGVGVCDHRLRREFAMSPCFLPVQGPPDDAHGHQSERRAEACSEQPSLSPLRLVIREPQEAGDHSKLGGIPSAPLIADVGSKWFFRLVCEMPVGIHHRAHRGRKAFLSFCLPTPEYWVRPGRSAREADAHGQSLNAWLADQYHNDMGYNMSLKMTGTRVPPTSWS